MSRISGFVIILATVLPCIVLFSSFNRIDRQKREPRRLILKLYAAGVASVLPAVLLEVPLLAISNSLPSFWVIPARAFFGIAFPEELVKIGAILLVVRKRRDFDEIIDGAVYGMAVALGFALLENIRYVLGSSDPLRTALLRGFTAIPLHALAGGCMGLTLGYYRIESRGSLVGALMAAIAVHGLYDLILMDSRIPGWLIIPLLIVGWTLLILAGRKAVQFDRKAGRSPFPLR